MNAVAVPAAASLRTPGQDASRAPVQATDLVARDARVGFDTASAQDARIQLDILRDGDPRRGPALVTLGASGAVAERGTLLAAAAEGVVEDRVAAILALGELGSAARDAVEALERLAASETGQLQAACLVALARTNEPTARAALGRFAAGEGVVAAQAKEILEHAVDPAGTPPPALWRHLYHLRWEAARLFGTVDGRPWRVVRIDELAADQAFLENLVLECAGTLVSPAAQDHVLAVLMQPGGRHARIDAALSQMPAAVERLVESDVWRPVNRSEWLRLVNVIVDRELWTEFPATLGFAAVTPEARPLVAGLLHRPGGMYEETLLESFRSEDSSARASAAFSVGCGNLTDYSTVLRELSQDPEPWVRANAWVARVRMAEASAGREIDAYFAQPESRRVPRLASFVFELLDRAAPDPDVLAFLEELSGRVTGADRIHAEAVLVLHDRRSDKRLLRDALPSLDPNDPDTWRVIRALGHLPGPEDLDALYLAFPFDGSMRANLLAAIALVEGRHRAVDPILNAAVWDLPLDLAVLAGGIVAEKRDTAMLRQWVARPPTRAREADLRRVGFVIGAWGGPKEVDALRADLGTVGGAEEPALVGAYLGLMTGRSR